LTFGCSFSQSLKNVQLPSGVQHLCFGLRVNQSMENVQSPSGSQNLASATN
jgi:ABC-type proline/glycine betaine transport system permease subunit